jgi:hypothetical protein
MEGSMLRRPRTLLLLSLLTLALGGCATHIDMRQQLDQAGAQPMARGYQRWTGAWHGDLREDSISRFRVRLEGGVRYIIVGVSSGRSLGIAVRHATVNLLGVFGAAADLLRTIAYVNALQGDSTSRLELVAPRTGRYDVSVQMGRCVANCAWAATIYQRADTSTPPAPRPPATHGP